VTVLLVAVWIGNPWPRDIWRRENFDSFDVYFGGVLDRRVVIGRQNLVWWIINSRPYPGDTSDWYPFDGKRWFVWKDSMTWAVGIPLWVFIAVCAGGTACAWRLDAVVLRRVRVDLCPKCDYDRTGLSAGAVCPECGSKAGGGPS